MSGPIRPLDPDGYFDPFPDGPSEFCWGPGLTPPGKEKAPPNEGGIYRAKAPPERHPRQVDPERIAARKTRAALRNFGWAD